MKGASSKQKKEKAPAVDRSRSITSTGSRVDEDLGSGEHGSRPHTSGTPGAEPVQILYLLPLSGNGQVTLPKSLLAEELRVIRMSDKPDIQDSRGSLNPSSGSVMSVFSGFSSVNDIPLPLLPVLSSGESSDETVTGFFVSTEKSVKQSGGTGHLEKSRRSGKSVQSDELWRPGSTVLADKPVRSGETIKSSSSRHRVSSGQSSVSVHSDKSGQADNPDSQFLSDSWLNPYSQK